MKELDRRYPSIKAMELAAARRVPKFGFDYMRGGIGNEVCLAANRSALDEIKLAPRYMVDHPIKPDLAKTLFGETYPLPFAPGPLGLSGLIWPRAIDLIATAATRRGLPVGLSSFATSSIEDIAAIAGERMWFQLYCTTEPDIENDLVDRAAAASCKVLIITVDIPTATRRERDIANGLSVPPQFNLSTVLNILARPQWALETLRSGAPRFRSLEPYFPPGAAQGEVAQFVSNVIEGHVTTDKLKRFRDRWRGTLIVKGILSPEDAVRCKEIGADAVVVSNHGGRQLDAAPTASAVLPDIRAAVGEDFPLLADGGVRSGLDVARLIACGADFVLLGRAFVFSVAAAGEAGVDHAIDILQDELRQTLAQTGCEHLHELADRRYFT